MKLHVLDVPFKAANGLWLQDDTSKVRFTIMLESGAGSTPEQLAQLAALLTDFINKGLTIT